MMSGYTPNHPQPQPHFYPISQTATADVLAHKTVVWDQPPATTVVKLLKLMSEHTIQLHSFQLQYNFVNAIERGMFCGAKSTPHTFTPIIKHQ